MNLSQVINHAKKEAAVAYANVELQRNLLRRDTVSRDAAAAYFLSTEVKRLMSSLLFLAALKDEPIRKSEAADKLGVTRQAASKILDETTAAGWVVEVNGAYKYAPDQMEKYQETIADMLVTMSTELSEKVQNLQFLVEISKPS